MAIQWKIKCVFVIYMNLLRLAHAGGALTSTVVFAGDFIAVVLLLIEKDIGDFNVNGSRDVRIHVPLSRQFSAKTMLPFDQNFTGHEFMPNYRT